MKAIKDIYRIGYGPSSSHTIGPMRIAMTYKERFPASKSYKVVLRGSLALTGRGHKTDRIIRECLGDDCEIVFDRNCQEVGNFMDIQGFDHETVFPLWHAESIGGGSIRIKEYPMADETEVYEHNSFNEIKDYINRNKISLVEYVLHHETDLLPYLDNVVTLMIDAVKRGLSQEGIISKRLMVTRTAKKLYETAIEENDEDLKKMAYAYAASEENATGGMVVTAPTLGSCGIIAGIAYYYHHDRHLSKDIIKEGLIVAGIFGNLVKTNASIAGATGGCQAEIGTACAMASAMIAYMEGYSTEVIEYAAEIGIEHHLGLTCDPVFGLVIIPCIERNAVGILRSFDAAKLSANLLRFKRHLVTFDMVVNSMNYTGKHISPELKETSLGGLALEFKDE